MPENMIEEWQTTIIENSVIVVSNEKFNVIKEDPDDNKFLEAAFAGKANFIISQDKHHILKLKEFKGIRIITPEEFLNITQKG